MIRPTPGGPAGSAWGTLGLVAVLLACLAGSARGETSAGVRWADSFGQALEQARVEQKYVMVDLFTSWCHWCKVLDEKTYRDGRVVGLTDRMVNVKVNAEAEAAIATRFGVRSYPTILFLNPDGSLRARVRGYQAPDAFVPVLEGVLAGEAELAAMGEQVAAAPQDPRLRLEFARILLRNGRAPEAVAQIDTLVSSRGLAADLVAEARLERAFARYRAGGGMKDARKELERWIKDAPQHPRRTEARYLLGLVRAAEGKGKEARRIFEEIARDSPGSWFGRQAADRAGRPS